MVSCKTSLLLPQNFSKVIFFIARKKKKKENKKQEKKNKKLIDFLKTKNILKHKAIAKYS